MQSIRAPILERLSALADLTRSRLLLVLDGRELTVGELCSALRLPQSTVSRHLKVLGDEGWVASRGEGTSRYYAMSIDRLDAGAAELWAVVRAEIAELPAVKQDVRRAESALGKRRSRMRAFFSSAAPAWDALRSEMIGGRADLVGLLEMLDDRWVVGDLGCGTGLSAVALAPCVARVIAVDESGPMLDEARRRVASFANVDLREGHIESLPIDDGTVDVALLFLVAHFIADPAQAMREVARVLKPGGRVVIVDLVTHDRADYVAELGHVWQGFSEVQISGWLTAAGFAGLRFRELPEDPDASGPLLFVSSARLLTNH
jgi:ubiquinone/menaquinone biosynthesis C-methylase UbiE